jgi:hypothetical protein
MLPADVVKEYREEISRALGYYRELIAKEYEKTSEKGSLLLWKRSFIDDARFSLLPQLREAVKNGDNIGGQSLKLLSLAVREYKSHLALRLVEYGTSKDLWANREAFKATIDRLGILLHEIEGKEK